MPSIVIDPLAFHTATLTAIVQGHPARPVVFGEIASVRGELCNARFTIGHDWDAKSPRDQSNVDANTRRQKSENLGGYNEGVVA